MARGGDRPSPPSARGTLDAVPGALSRVEVTDRAFKRRRIDSPVLTCDESTTPPASFRSRTSPRREMIRSPLVSFRAIGFRGERSRTARARTFSALRRRAVARGLTRLGRRVDEREFLSCRSRADRCGRCGDRRRFAGGLASVEANSLSFCGFSRLPTPRVLDRVPAFVVQLTSILKPMDGNSCAPLVSSRISRFAIRRLNSVCRFDSSSISTFRKLARESSLFLDFWRSWHSRHSRATRVLPGSGRAAENGHGGRARVRDAPSRAGGRLWRDASARAEAGRATRCAEKRAGRRAPR
jgi:hypothetical protein